MENYQKIISAFLNGNVEGLEEEGLIPEHMETQISHLLLFSETVYKICKRDNIFFNKNIRDLADSKTRMIFYELDFFMNNYFSPDVYLSLSGIFINDNKVLISDDFKDAEDIVIKMKRIDSNCNLSRLLHDKTLSVEDFQFLGYQQAKKIDLYPHQPKSEKTYYEIFQEKLEDLKKWMYLVPEYFSKNEADKIMNILRKYLEKERDSFENYEKNKYVVTLDNHSDNIFFKNKKIFFLDIYPPKKNWIIGTPWLNMYRLAADILIIAGEKYARALIHGYKDYYGFLDEKHEKFYFMYNAAIQAVSLYNLSNNNLIKKRDSLVYRSFILKNIVKLA